VAEYRNLRFASIDDCTAEVRRILAAEAEGRLRAAGNWTPGQIMAHVAAWIEYGYEGYPIGPPPFFVRWILRLRLRKMLKQGMPRGVRIPGLKDGTVGMDQQPTAEAGGRLLRALKRLQDREEAGFDSPAFGPMSHDDRIQLNLRHAELHLGYLAY
jgi:hypothetical protein